MSRAIYWNERMMLFSLLSDSDPILQLLFQFKKSNLFLIGLFYLEYFSGESRVTIRGRVFARVEEIHFLLLAPIFIIRYKSNIPLIYYCLFTFPSIWLKSFLLPSCKRHKFHFLLPDTPAISKTQEEKKNVCWFYTKK